MKNDFFDASGDMFPVQKNFTNDIISNATGDINQTCQLNLPHSDEQMKNLQNIVSVALNNKARTEADYKNAYETWRSCKAKVFCNAGPKKEPRDQAEVLFNAAELAYNSSIENYNRAKMENDQAQTQYNTCVTQQTEILKLQPVPVEAPVKEEDKVAISSSGSLTPTIQYGLIGLGVVVVLVAGYLAITK
jgi:hypothetical protein